MGGMTRRVPAAFVLDREKVLYLVVGAWNTLFAYGAFSACWYLLHDHLHPDVILLIAYLIGSVNGFIGFRLVVFKSKGHVLKEYLKYQVVYGSLLLANMVVLPLGLAYSSLSAYMVQALFAVFAVIAGYLGSKYFAFRGSADAHSDAKTTASRKPLGDREGRHT